MLGIILGALAILGIIIAVIACIFRTPDNLRGFYGAMFWTIAVIAIVGVVGVAVLGLL
jgi:hypothetical protein